MDIFANFYNFYKQKSYTDLTISIINLDGSITYDVCKTHRLLFVSLFPKFRDIFEDIKEDDSNIFIEDCDENEVIDTIEAFYKCLIQKYV